MNFDKTGYQLTLLCPPSERSETGGHTVFTFVRVSIREHSYLDANIPKTVWDRGLVPISHK